MSALWLSEAVRVRKWIWMITVPSLLDVEVIFSISEEDLSFRVTRSYLVAMTLGIWLVLLYEVCWISSICRWTRSSRLAYTTSSTHLHNMLNSRAKHQFSSTSMTIFISCTLPNSLLDLLLPLKTNLDLSFLASRLAFSYFQNDHLTLLRRSWSSDVRKLQWLQCRLANRLRISPYSFHTFHWRVGKD